MNYMLNSIFDWLDTHEHTKNGKLINQIFPASFCLLLFIFFILSSIVFIEYIINPYSSEKVRLEIHLADTLVGFFLYFVTAIDYALIVGRMQNTNTGSRARFLMNVFTCIGCFFGVSFVLFLWGFAKEVAWLILPLLMFAGCVMVKLAYEGREYFEHAQIIPSIIRLPTTVILSILYYLTRIFTFWIPELGNPSVKKLSYRELAQWSFFLPFIIGIDDLIGYMGAMTIYNAFSLIVGIYLADIVIDRMIFVSPTFTKKVVENPALSLIAAYAFLYLAYKSFSESIILIHEKFFITTPNIIVGIIVFFIVVIAVDFVVFKERNWH